MAWNSVSTTTDGFEARLRSVLENLERAPKRVEMDVPPDAPITAAVVSGGFRGQPHDQRQEVIWSHLRRELSEDELTRIRIVLALTPEAAQDDDEPEP